MARSAASCSAASRPLNWKPRSSRWAAPTPRHRKRGRPRPQCAPSGKRGARIWTFSAMDAAALFEIATLNARCAAVLDTDLLEQWPAFFHEQCLYKVTPADNHARGYQAGIIYADTQAMLIDRVSALREANIYERQRYRHILGLPLIAPQADGSVTAEASFLVVRTMRGGQMDG